MGSSETRRSCRFTTRIRPSPASYSVPAARSMISAARPGDTVVVREGTYGARGTTTTVDATGAAGAPIIFRRYPGDQKPVILGHFEITGDYLRFWGFLFDGPTGDVGGNAGCAEHPGESVLVTIRGRNDEVAHSEVRNSYGNAGIYVSAGSGTGIQISHNWIHDNGGFGVCGATLVNGQCGVYDYNGAALVVTHNLVWHNYDSNTCGSGMTLSSNITADPLFVGANIDSPPAPLRVDRRWTVEEAGGSADYHLAGRSPAIDRASATYTVPRDYDGVIRPQGPAPDIGAFEER